MTHFTLRLLLTGILLLGFSVHAAVNPAVEEARKAYDFAALETLQKNLLEQAKKNPEDPSAQFAVAECFSVRAAFNRRDRFIQGENKAKRKQQNEWGKAVMPYAEKALKLAKTDSEKAHAHRILGELMSHQITGMMSGMRLGPKSKKHTQAALELLPDDAECQRALGLMYLYNPGMSGGDPKKAVTTFQACAKAAPNSDAYLLLQAMAHRKAGEVEKAREVAEQCLALNPKNADAQNLLKVLK
jgi:tetratricopeptide (TPR) repeat protein